MSVFLCNILGSEYFLLHSIFKIVSDLCFSRFVWKLGLAVYDIYGYSIAGSV